MNVFHKFTLMSLKRSRSRTLVTVIGIILSMAMFTAVIEGSYSGLQYLIRSETARTGAFHGYFYDLTYNEVKSIEESAETEAVAYWQEVGWAKIGSQNTYKPYLLIKSISGNFSDMVSVSLLQGRMPENDGEIILPEHLSSNGNVKYSIGDIVTLSVGKRSFDGESLNEFVQYNPEQEEELVDSVQQTYSIVGFYERFDYIIENYDCPGYMALTTGKADGVCTAFFKLKRPSGFYSYVQKSDFSDRYRSHSDLLRYSGSLRNDNLMVVLYGFAAILIFLIAFGSISLIYNSFSISVSERTRQFGILKSVGATKKQIRGCVICEAILLCAVGVPVGLIGGCSGIGITLWFLRDSFSTILGPDYTVQMSLALNPLALLTAAVICIVTTLISAWLPARKAIRIEPIDAIRQSKNVKVGRKDVFSPKLVQKLFGFEGMLASKNFRRDRKRYRSTVISLFLSVTLFISASSFCSYLKDTVGGITPNNNGVDIKYTVSDEVLSNPDTLASLLANAGGVTDAAYYKSSYTNIGFNTSYLTEKYLNMPFVSEYDFDNETGRMQMTCCIMFPDDGSFRRLCEDNGLKSDDYFNRNAPAVIAYNNLSVGYSEEDEPAKWYNFDLINKEKMPATGYVTKVKSVDGYELYDDIFDEDGNKLYRYLPKGYSDENISAGGPEGGGGIDENMALVIPSAEAEIKTPIKIGAIIESVPFYMPQRDIFVVFCPYSMRQLIMGETANFDSATIYAFRTDNHSQTLEQMKTILLDNNLSTLRLYDAAASNESDRMLITVINVFSYGFIVLISLISVANVFNTVSTNISLRRREIGMLKSIGLSNKGLRRMMNFECIIYGARSLLWGLPAAAIMTYVIYRVSGTAYETEFYIPWYSILIAVGSVFAVVFATMMYATGKIKKDNPIDALKTENL